MHAERPPSHSEQRLRSTLHRARPSPSPPLGHSHASSPPPTSSAETDDELIRAAFLCRTAAAPSSPIHPPRLYSRPVSPSPSQQSESDPNLRRTSRRKTTSLRSEESCPLSRAKLERVLRNGRVVEGRSRSREPCRRDSDSSSAGWPWSDIHSGTATKRPISSTSSESSHCPKDYFHQHASPYPTLSRSRSKTDSALPQHHPASPRRTATYSPSMLPKSLPSSRAHPTPRRNDSAGSGTTALTPPLTADTSPLFNNNHQHEHPQACVDPDDMRLLTPPPTPPLLASPYMHPYKRREIDVGSVERLDLTLATVRTTATSPRANTFNARKASETCRRMEGYVSFAAVEGLGMPPNGVDDDENDGCDDARADDLKRGTNIIGTWARKLFVGITPNHPAAAAPGNSNPTTTSVA